MIRRYAGLWAANEGLGHTEWRTEFQTKIKPPDPALLKKLAADRKAKFDAAAKALQDQQDSDIAAQNAQIDKEYQELTSR